MEPLTDQENAYLSMMLYGLCFAFPAFSYAVMSSAGGELSFTGPVSYFLGTFLAACLLWRPFRSHLDSYQTSVWIGALIGLLMIPFCFLLMIVLQLIVDFGSMTFASSGTQGWALTLTIELFEQSVVGFIWYTVMIVLFVGWLPAAVGAFIGVVIATAYRVEEPGYVQQELGNTGRSPLRAIRRKENAHYRLLYPATLVRTHLIALAIVIGFTHLGVWFVR